MITFGYSVHDKAVGAFLPLFFCRSKGEAIRSFTQVVQKGDHQFNQNKGDYDLYECGQWDDNSGIFTPNPEGVVRVISAIEIGDPA